MKRNKTTLEKIQYIVSLKQLYHTWKVITTYYNMKFAEENSINAIRHLFRKHANKDVDSSEIDYVDLKLDKKVSLKTHKTFIITSACPTTHLDQKKDDSEIRSNLDKRGLNSLLNICKRLGGEFIVLPMRAHVMALNRQPNYFDKELLKHIKNFTREYRLHKYLVALDMRLNPQQINPITGMHNVKNVGRQKRGDSIIIAHPRQNMQVTSVGNTVSPRVIHTTGSITFPRYLDNRIGRIAENGHVMGGLLVEIKGDVFFIRQLQIASSDGSVVDMGYRYFPSGDRTEEQAEAVKLGDIHANYFDAERFKKYWGPLLAKLSPKRLFLEDIFDGDSISRFNVKHPITKAIVPTLMEELQNTRKALSVIKKMVPKLCEMYITYANHNTRLARYVDSTSWLRDNHSKQTYSLLLQASSDALSGRDALQGLIDARGKHRWLEHDSDIWVEGVQMGAHGHLGANGAKGSILGFTRMFDKAMIGHFHTPCIRDGIYVTGVVSSLRHAYSKGPSAWIECSGAVYKGGHCQLYMIIQNKCSWLKEEK